MIMRGRKKIEIDQKQFEGLCKIMCTKEEIAGWFGCSEDTVERWCKRTYGGNFAVIYKKYSANGRISLRRAQLKLAEKNAAMAIFLGKQYLGQRDSFDVVDTTAINKLDELLKQTQEMAEEIPDEVLKETA